MKFFRLIILVLSIICLTLLSNSCGDNPASSPNNIDTTKKDTTADTTDTTPTYNTVVPNDCHDWWRYSWSGDPVNPMSDYKAIQIWIHAMTIDPNPTADYGNKNSACVKMKYLRLIEHDTANKTYTNYDLYYNFDTPRPLRNNEGQNYERYYRDGTVKALDNSLVENGELTVWPSWYGNRASHWWLFSGQKLARKTGCVYYVECEMKISGKLAVMLGGDFWRKVDSPATADNITECFHSLFYTDTDGKYLKFIWPPKKN